LYSDNPDIKQGTLKALKRRSFSVRGATFMVIRWTSCIKRATIFIIAETFKGSTVIAI
jgi:hypothetical protein